MNLKEQTDIKDETLRRSEEKIKEITPLIHQIVMCELKMEYRISNSIRNELEVIQDWSMETIKSILIRPRFPIIPQ